MNRRLCSVWQSGDCFYRYYAIAAHDDGEARTKQRPPIRPPLGDPPEILLGVLPEGALYVGCGSLARGEIVVAREGAA